MHASQAISAVRPAIAFHGARPSPRHAWRQTCRNCSLSSAGISPAQPAKAPSPHHARKATQEEIAARIADSKRRRAALPPPLHCPACSIGVGTVAAMARHLCACCPDLLVPAEAGAWAAAAVGLASRVVEGDLKGRAAAEALLLAVGERERAAREEAIRLTFRSGELEAGSNTPARLSCRDVAGRMRLPERRVSELLSRAMRAYPMPADPEPVEVLYEDEDLIGVNKPPGLNTAPAHRYRGGSMVNRLIGHLGRPPLPLHRLDMDTSGLLLFAKSRRVVEAVAKQFRQRTVSKWYLALCIGVPEQRSFEVRVPIGRHPTEAVARVAVQGGDVARGEGEAEGEEEDDSEEGVTDLGSPGRRSMAAAADSDVKQAWTSFRVVASNPDADFSALAKPGLLFDSAHSTQLRGVSLIACQPHSGRTHQIRVHCQHVGHPLLGDELYGVQGPWIARQALHAAALHLVHPLGGRPLRLSAPLPLDMLAALDSVGLPLANMADPNSFWEEH